ncbi:receptor-mediated endocytosis protein 6 homolog [Tribolium madens]|uniref:receptor-mediated endocytosis protein 6 homolog n=1 Tax=Tribolium madens TaxID=41895 RepID=UPI001CF74CDF|nr:receptor-mediated endocytosis protein 6 homolog [Tribolium madens]XP_044257840.1 receptor-mediated endocytosis protein 6 homolog [Tribolium madens]
MKDNESEEKEDRNVFKLLSQLRKEKLFITNERLNIQKLNKSIKKKTDGLIEATWMTTKQRLYLLSQREFTTQNYEHIKSITNSEFVEAKTLLGYQTVKINNLLQNLRKQPEELAKWLFVGEQINDDQFSHVLQTVVTGLYSSCIFPEDTSYMLKLLLELAKLQLLKSENPRRMLKQGTCSFKNLFFIFTEVLPTAKFFLSAALELPILRLAACRDFYLDVDPDKTLMRYRHNENNLKSEFRDIQEYRTEVIRKLSEFTNSFISSLRENVYSFPKPIAWIVYHISKIITKSFGSKEAYAIVTELIFTLYICPAIVDPEQYCICDAQITEVTQHNLMQVGQILQVLALNKFESPENRFSDIYNLLDNDIVCNFMEDILFNLEFDDDTPPVDLAPTIIRDSALLAEDELNNFILFLQKVHNEMVQNDNFKKHLGDSSIEEQIASLILPSSLENSPKTSKPYTNGFSENTLKRNHFLSLVTKNHTSKSRDEISQNIPLTVLIFSMDKDLVEPVGLLPEEKILNMNLNVKKEVILPNPPSEIITEAVNGRVEEKPFSNFPDEGSIGNTSDNLEAISEAASNHSVASSLELENDQNDNLSDMISANVSGRGTPNISGRDTPSSQVNDNEERPLPEARQVEQPQPQISRQIRSEIDDKFCKFEIKKLLEGDETISIISETWSTDVLASDNETIDAGDSRAERQGLQLVDQAISEVPTGNILDISETQSESAWSTDVMASDTERLTEVDNDDAGSVAQSDETRSETDENPTSRRLSNSSNYVNYYQEYRKVEIKNNVKTDNNANNVLFKSVTLTDTQHNLSFGELKIARKKDVPGPSGFNPTELLKQNTYDERPNEILLSNCSLNSSSSGSSSNSFENKHSHTEACWESKQWLNSSGSSLNVTSTPSESTSELSVLSVSNLNPNILVKKAATLNRNLKPSASTGAIPKSISFDMSADKGDKYLDDDQRSKRGGFFGKLRMGFRNRRGKSFRNQDDFRLDGEEFGTGKKTPNESPVKISSAEVSEDILAKYRAKPFVESTPKEANGNDKIPKIRSEDSADNVDVNNSFDDIKRKLRLVLSNTTSQTPKVIKENRLSVKSKVETILRLELGKARKLKEWSNIARISETLRFINLLNESTCLSLFQSLREDFLQRSVYTDYLIYSRQELLFCQSYLDGLSEQVNNDKQQCEKYLSMICVRKFLLDEESRITQFCEEFKDITLFDEKCDFLNNFYEQVYSIMQRSGLWQDVFKNQGDAIKITLERCIMSKIYKYALYPNGDGDRDRDHVLFQHIEKLASIISPDHKDLMIHKMFLREMPWIPAQDALKAMNAYKTPRDKVKCVVHCAKCIMDLLSFSQNSGSTTADDFTPVLVYVIIRVNPADLLSTIQFVNSFYHNQIDGEELYWWTQFCSAVEYIKTMDYSD